MGRWRRAHTDTHTDTQRLGLVYVKQNKAKTNLKTKIKQKTQHIPGRFVEYLEEER